MESPRSAFSIALALNSLRSVGSPVSRLCRSIPDEHCPQSPILLAVDQVIGEGSGTGFPSIDGRPADEPFQTGGGRVAPRPPRPGEEGGRW